MQFDEYLKNNYNIKSIIAIDGSPSCGYNKTCSSEKWCGELCGCTDLMNKINDVQMVDGKGIFIEELEKLLNEYNLNIPIVGLDESEEGK